MSNLRYRGDSPGKEAARCRGYARLTSQHLYHCSHIVVAGEGGDIDYLIRQGVSPASIIACDKNYYYLANAKKKHGVTTAPYAKGRDLLKTVRWAVEEGKPIASINVDLCMSLIKGAPILRKVLEIAPHDPWLKISFTFLCGHDPGLRKNKWEDNPGQKRLDYFHEVVGRPMKEYYAYQSWTRTSWGSPMCTAYL